MATKVTTAPYDHHGALMHYPEDQYDYGTDTRVVIKPDWRPNVPFRATFMLKGSARGRSAAYYLWEDAAGREWPMFITDMTDRVRHESALHAGVATATWMVAKRGENYGLRLATEDEIAAAGGSDG